MDFIEDDDLARQSETADGKKLHRHDSLQRLVNGAHTIRGDKRLFGRSKPGSGFANVGARIIAVVLFQSRANRLKPKIKAIFEPSMGMSQTQIGFLHERRVEEFCNAFVNSVTGHLGGQRKIESMMMAGCDKLLRCMQCCLGLAAAHWGFDDDQPRFGGGAGYCFLNRVGVEIERFSKGCLP